MMQYINQGKKNDMVVVFLCLKEIRQWLHAFLSWNGLENECRFKNWIPLAMESSRVGQGKDELKGSTPSSNT